jgi:AcrR family transcriptional regulator
MFVTNLFVTNMIVMLKSMTGRSRTLVSRRERPAKPALTREGIIATAVAVLRAEGLEKVTMRRLAQELDTGPASLYVYVANTAELHAAVLDELLGEVDLEPAGDNGGWRERLIGVLMSYTGVLFRHPGLARAALSAPPSGEHYMRLLETLLALLDEGDVPSAQAAWGVDVLLQFGTATAAEHSIGERSAGVVEQWGALALAVREAAETTHPHVHAVAESLLAGSPEDRMSWCFQMLINGIASTPPPHSIAKEHTP